MKLFLIGLFFLSILFTLVSQVPQILELNISIYFQSIWFLLILSLLLSKQFYLSEKINKLAFLVFFLVIYVFVMEVLSEKPYLHTAHYINMSKSFMILSISYYMAPLIPERKFNQLLGYIALFGGMILIISVYQHSFISGYDITSRQYAYTAKNSVSQIILGCVITVLFLLHSKSMLLTIVKVLFIFFSIYILFILKSRATIIGLIFVLIALIFVTNNKKLKYYTLLLISIMILVLVYNHDLLQIIYKNILLANRTGGLDEISSGRLKFFTMFPDIFIENVWFGRGRFFSESFLLSILINYGVIGSTVIIIFILQPILFYRKYLKAINPLNLTFLLLLLTFYFNGLFEEQAPFGPGSKNFMLWLIFGYLLQKHMRGNKNAKSTY